MSSRPLGSAASCALCCGPRARTMRNVSGLSAGTFVHAWGHADFVHGSYISGVSLVRRIPPARRGVPENRRDGRRPAARSPVPQTAVRRSLRVAIKKKNHALCTGQVNTGHKSGGQVQWSEVSACGTGLLLGSWTRSHTSILEMARPWSMVTRQHGIRGAQLA